MTNLGSDFRQEFAEVPLKSRVWKFNAAAIVGIPLAAILFQVYVPRFFTYLAYLELPLLVTVYFSLMRRSPGAGYSSARALVWRKTRSRLPIRWGCSDRENPGDSRLPPACGSTSKTR
jgi:hypothetical protein